MTPDQERLLLATARIVRANLLAPMRATTRVTDVQDLTVLIDACGARVDVCESHGDWRLTTGPRHIVVTHKHGRTPHRETIQGLQPERRYHV